MSPITLPTLTILSLFVSYATAQETTPAGPTQPNISKSCNAWHTVVSGDGCWSIEQNYSITHENFIQWNPDVSNDCITNFWPTYSYCVAVGAPISSTTSMSSSTSATTSKSTSRTITSSSTTPTANATYSIREPITSYNLTTSTIESVFPPKHTQAGQPSYCNDWHLVEIGNTCENIVGANSWLTMSDL